MEIAKNIKKTLSSESIWYFIFVSLVGGIVILFLLDEIGWIEIDWVNIRIIDWVAIEAVALIITAIFIGYQASATKNLVDKTLPVKVNIGLLKKHGGTYLSVYNISRFPVWVWIKIRFFENDRYEKSTGEPYEGNGFFICPDQPYEFFVKQADSFIDEINNGKRGKVYARLEYKFSINNSAPPNSQALKVRYGYSEEDPYWMINEGGVGVPFKILYQQNIQHINKMSGGEKEWKLLKEYTLLEDRFIKIKRKIYLNLLSKNDEIEDYSIVTFAPEGTVVAVALTEDKKVLLLRQYRPAANRWIINLPGGRVENGETPESVIIKEIEQESDGKYSTKESDLIRKYETYQNPARVTDKSIIFFAKIHESTNQIKDTLKESAEAGTKPIIVDFEKVVKTLSGQKVEIEEIESDDIFDMTTVAALLLVDKGMKFS